MVAKVGRSTEPEVGLLVVDAESTVGQGDGSVFVKCYLMDFFDVFSDCFYFLVDCNAQNESARNKTEE